jgi:hypothetical protein
MHTSASGRGELQCNWLSAGIKKFPTPLLWYILDKKEAVNSRISKLYFKPLV